jgi:kumamolisin
MRLPFPFVRGFRFALQACWGFVAVQSWLAAPALALTPVANDERILSDSVLPLSPARDAVGNAKVKRPVVAAGEAGEELSFSIALRMPDLAGLKLRIGNKERVTEEEMEARYRPDRRKHESVSRWLQQQGFRITIVDETHTTIFARGRIADLARVFKVEFGRVTTAEGDYTSALGAPAIPAAFADVILAVNGLQPQFRPRHVSVVKQSPSAGKSGGVLPTGQFAVTPANIVDAYKIPKDLNGSGQTIALIEESGVTPGDLTTFWSAMGVAQSVSNVTVIGDSAVSTDSSLFGEATLDVEWAGALAPASKLRVYVVAESFDATNTQILNDVVKNRLPITVLSISFAALEADLSGGAYQTSAQIYAQLAAAGVSVFASSGDTGTNSVTAGGGGSYNANYPLIIGYPASDPSVTGVGGTTMSLDQNSVKQGEVVWSYISVGGANGTGGGVSTLFSKPSWQYGGSVLAASAMRCVPDVAALADFGAIYQKGTWGTIGGTSLAAPIWGAICALINQSRSSAGLKPVGLLNTYLYSSSLNGGFNDITSGMNGAYRAGAGYDLCTGLGTPNLTNLISVLGSAAGVNISSQPNDQAVTLGQPATLTVAGSAAAGPLTYQWYFNGVAIAGATGASYTIPTTTLADAGSYDVAVTGKAGTVVSMPASLKLNYISAITLQPQSTKLSVGQNLVFSVSVTGYPTPTYQWQKSTNAGAAWTNVSDGNLTAGSTTYRLSFGPATQDLSSTQFRVLVSNASGTVTSSAATVTVEAATDSSVVYQVETLAGKVTFGSDNGAASAAKFNQPAGVAMAESGNLYVADTQNNLIRKITPEGEVSTFAGGGLMGSSLDGTGTNASFNVPQLIAVDAAENLYIGEANTNVVRKITSAGWSPPSRAAALPVRRTEWGRPRASGCATARLR